MTQEIRCGFGLAGRVAAMANGLSHFGQIRFVWRVNEQCPEHHSAIFPNGIPGVEFVDDAPPAFATRIEGISIDSWKCAKDRDAANKAYAMIIFAMAGESLPNAPKIACFARYFREASLPPFDLGREAGVIAAQRGLESVFILSDCNRAEITRGLSVSGISHCLPSSPEMTKDKDRATESVMQFASDWKTLLSAKTIVCATPKSGLMYPAYAAGIQCLAL